MISGEVRTYKVGSWPLVVPLFFALVVACVLFVLKVVFWYLWTSATFVVFLLLLSRFSRRCCIELDRQGLRYTGPRRKVDVVAKWSEVIAVKLDVVGEGSLTRIETTNGSFFVDMFPARNEILRVVYDNAPNVRFFPDVPTPPEG